MNKAHREIKLFFKQLCVPIRDVNGVQKGHPFSIARHTKSLLHEWRPLRLKWLSHQRHGGLVRRPATLAAIAFMTRAHHVLPSRGAALGAGNDVVEIEVMSW